MTYEYEGKTEKEAIEKAAAELGLEKDQFDVEILPLSDISLTHTVHMGYLKNHYQIPVIKEFIQFVKKHTNR